MEIVERETVQENGHTYIVETYDTGAINKYIVPNPDAPPCIPAKDVTNEDILERIENLIRVQRGHVEAAGTSVTIPLEPVDVSRATVSISGPVKAYTLSAEALAVTLTEPGYINWEVRE